MTLSLRLMLSFYVNIILFVKKNMWMPRNIKIGLVILQRNDCIKCCPVLVPRYITKSKQTLSFLKKA